MTLLATVLYEDQTSPDASRKSFSLHDLLLTCVSDDLGGELHVLRKLIRGIPRKGRDKVLADCEGNEWLLYSPQGQPVIAFVDYDEIHKAGRLKVSKGACLLALRSAFKANVQPDDHVSLVVLRDNMESILKAIRDRRLITDDLMPRVDQAIAKKGSGLLIARDEVLKALTWGKREHRDSLREAVPSVDYLIRALAWVVAFGQ